MRYKSIVLYINKRKHRYAMHNNEAKIYENDVIKNALIDCFKVVTRRQSHALVRSVCVHEVNTQNDE